MFISAFGTDAEGTTLKVQKEDHDCMNHRRGRMQESQQGALSQTELQGCDRQSSWR